MVRTMKLGLSLGYWGRGPDPDALEKILEAEAMGFDSMWTAEAWGSDALTPLAWYGSRTTTMMLGQSITQISARTPAATAMAMQTLQHLSDGRVICGLGVSGPQVVEGWYGQPFAKPLARTREYVSILEQVWERETPVTSDGPHYPLPYPTDAPGAAGKGKPLRSITHPHPVPIPVYLAAEGRKNLALAGEIADGWLPLWMSPDESDWYRRQIQVGMDRVPGKTWDGFGVAAIVPTLVLDDLDAAIDLLRPQLALYIGGMGAKDENYHYEVFARMNQGRGRLRAHPGAVSVRAQAGGHRHRPRRHGRRHLSGRLGRSGARPRPALGGVHRRHPAHRWPVGGRAGCGRRPPPLTVRRRVSGSGGGCRARLPVGRRRRAAGRSGRSPSRRGR